MASQVGFFYEFKWSFFTETDKSEKGKNPKSGYFSIGLEVLYEDMF